MSKYPYIGRGELTDVNYLVYSNDCFYSFDNEDFYQNINQGNLKNITREYLTDTYGKCESKEHADFICKLARVHGIPYTNDYGEYHQWFNFGHGCLDFYGDILASSDGERLITLPLPPIKKEIPSTQVVESEQASKTDHVKNPKHYQFFDGLEAIEIIATSMTREQFYGYCLGNKLKYRLRAGEKDNLQQDIDKSNFYGELYEIHKDKCK